MRVVIIVLLLLFFIGNPGCLLRHDQSTPTAIPMTTSTPEFRQRQELIHLPEPHLIGTQSLEECLSNRRSIRHFTPQELTLEELSQLLWSCQGITSNWGGRTAPSAGALYPLETYVSLPDGFYHYAPSDHALELLSEEDLRTVIWRASLEQSAVKEAPTLFLITADYARTAKKYGDRATRYVHMEAGHAAQNLLLQAVALDLRAVPIGAFHDQQLGSLLPIEQEYAPLYIIPIGHPAE